MFVEEGGSSLKSKQKGTGNRGPSTCVRSLFLEKMLRFSKWSFKVILQFFILIIMTVWNIKQTIMKFTPVNNDMRLLSPVLVTLHNFLFFSLHCSLFSLCIFSKNGYSFTGCRQCVLHDRSVIKCTNVL